MIKHRNKMSYLDYVNANTEQLEDLKQAKRKAVKLAKYGDVKSCRVGSSKLIVPVFAY